MLASNIVGVQVPLLALQKALVPKGSGAFVFVAQGDLGSRVVQRALTTAQNFVRAGRCAYGPRADV